MKIATFNLERFFAKHEFSAEYLLSCSDCEPLCMSQLLQMADHETQALWQNLKLSYSETQGHPRLRHAISEMYQGISPSNILEVIPEEGIFLLMHTLLQPGDHIVCTFPGYQSLYEIARSMGCTLSFWMPAEENGWRFDVDHLKKHLRSDTKLVVVNFPHNPTGYLPTIHEFETIVDTVRQHGIYMLSDEMYRFLEIFPNTTLPSASELYDQSFSLCGVSKTFGLPGLRVGWIVSQNRNILSRVSELKDYTTICASAPSEILAIIAIQNRDAIIAAQMQRLQKNLSILDAFFSANDHIFSWNRPLGGSVCFPRLMIPETADLFCRRVLEGSGIMLVPSSVFEFGDRHVRFGLGRENLPEVVDRLSQFLNSSASARLA